ncbi:hypothetical protein [Hyalangium gracile]|uniref:hypothetical protein n=1 Tax=Hyalangium gracile TaxID=394092 RepID=UPI001CCE6AA7|nr:hypothetical protein [Hyalangium gracile]
MVLTLTGQAVALRSDKPFVTSEDSAQVEVSVLDDSGRPLRDAQVSLTVNIGSLTEPVPSQDGTFTATYKPPSQEGPQVALLHATVRQGARSSGAWLALPVHGSHRLRVQAPPRARVRVSIGAASYGPVTASASGEALLPVKLPPGAESAQVTITDRAGKSRTQTVPLPAPRFARVQLVALEPPVQGRTVRLQGFVVDDSGNPAVALPALTVSAEQGSLGPIEPKEGGVFELPYTASTSSSAPVTISASPLEEAERSASLQVEPLPAAAGTATDPRATTQDPAVASSGATTPESQRMPWQRTLGAFFFAHTNTAAANGFGLQAQGALRLGTLPLEGLALLELRGNGDVSETIGRDGPNPVTKTFSLDGLGLRLGARWSHPFLARGVLFADASLGFLAMGGEVLLKDLQENERREDVRSVGPSASVGGGLAWPLGPGSLCGQLHWAYAPGRGLVSGNLGGLSFGVGYQLSFGGRTRP